jgi:predicted nucleic acid-binding protein
VATIGAVILVDTNILLDVVTSDPRWGDWSQRQLDAASSRDRLVINAVIYAETAPGFARIEELDAAIANADLALVEIPRAALFLAAKAFSSYRRRGGAKTGVLPDFFIGAHAAVAGMPLITRDPARHRSYFPTVELIAPER